MRVDIQPTVLPELQNKSVISVSLGDFHYCALTADGRVFTWGAYMNGCLGLGDPATLEPGTPGAFADQGNQGRAHWRQRRRPLGGRVPNVEVPSEVHFDWEPKTGKRRGRKHFAISITAAGWHTGALVADLGVSAISTYLL